MFAGEQRMECEESTEGIAKQDLIPGVDLIASRDEGLQLFVDELEEGVGTPRPHAVR